MRSPIPPDVEHVIFFHDGSVWIAVRPDFADIQTSPTGAGVSRAEAYDDFMRQEARAKGLGLSAAG